MQCRHKYKRTPHIEERWGHALWGGTLLTPKSKPIPHICYHAKFVLRQRVYATSLNCSLLPALRTGLPHFGHCIIHTSTHTDE